MAVSAISWSWWYTVVTLSCPKLTAVFLLGQVGNGYRPEFCPHHFVQQHAIGEFAEAAHAAGVLEGIKYYNFLDKIVIPNDRIE